MKAGRLPIDPQRWLAALAAAVACRCRCLPVPLPEAPAAATVPRVHYATSLAALMPPLLSCYRCATATFTQAAGSSCCCRRHRGRRQQPTANSGPAQLNARPTAMRDGGPRGAIMMFKMPPRRARAAESVNLGGEIPGTRVLEYARRPGTPVYLPQAHMDTFRDLARAAMDVVPVPVGTRPAGRNHHHHHNHDHHDARARLRAGVSRAERCRHAAGGHAYRPQRLRRRHLLLPGRLEWSIPLWLQRYLRMP